jgi:hypothetical protein
VANTGALGSRGAGPALLLARAFSADGVRVASYVRATAASVGVCEHWSSTERGNSTRARDCFSPKAIVRPARADARVRGEALLRHCRSRSSARSPKDSRRLPELRREGNRRERALTGVADTRETSSEPAGDDYTANDQNQIRAGSERPSVHFWLKR